MGVLLGLVAAWVVCRLIAGMAGADDVLADAEARAMERWDAAGTTDIRGKGGRKR